MIPSVTTIARPSGYTSTSRATKSVSGAEDAAYRVYVYRAYGRVVLRKLLTRVHEHVRPVLDRPLIHGTRLIDLGHQECPADGRYGLFGVVVVLVGRATLRLFTREYTPRVQVPPLFTRAGDGPLLVAAPAILAHHEDLYRGVSLQSALVAFEGGVEPAEVIVGDVALAVEEQAGGGEAKVEAADHLREGGAMAPRADKESRGSRAPPRRKLLHRLVLPQGLSQEDVVPAANVEGGNLYVVVAAVDVQILPDGTCDAVLQGTVQVRYDAARVRQVLQGESLVMLGEVVYHVDLGGQELLELLRSVTVFAEKGVEGKARLAPVQPQAELPHPAPVLLAVQVVAPSDPRHQAPQGGRPHDGGLPLGHAEVRGAVHTDLAVRARELRRPLYRIVAVLELVHRGAQLALRAEAASDVLDHGYITVFGRLYRAHVARGNGEILAVRQPRQENRILPLRGSATRPVDVGHEGRTVAHRGGDVLLDHDFSRPAHTLSSRILSDEVW